MERWTVVVRVWRREKGDGRRRDRRKRRRVEGKMAFKMQCDGVKGPRGTFWFSSISLRTSALTTVLVMDLRRGSRTLRNHKEDGAPRKGTTPHERVVVVN